MNTAKFHIRYVRFAHLLPTLVALLVSLLARGAQSSYQVSRPIHENGGVINQGYLYGEEASGYTHQGIDFSYPTGTPVYAVASGVVVAVRQSVDDGDHSDNYPFGNYVMIRHSQQHYDRTVAQLAHVYSIYAHLKKNSVAYSIGAFVPANAQIAQVNNTGNSTGPHLHLQINFSRHYTETNPEDWTWSEATTRNPEVWLQAFNDGGTQTATLVGPSSVMVSGRGIRFNDGGTQTATLVGKVTYNNGAPVPNLYIYGVSKPDAAGGAAFDFARTYVQSYTNPDDYLVENFATTDIAPGTHCLEARYSSNSLYANLGCHNFVAGRTTYVGLYPVYLPDLRNQNGWTSQVRIVNNSDMTSTYVTTNILWSSGGFHSQRNDHLGPHASLTFNSPIDGIAKIVGSQDLSVVVVHERSNPYVTDTYAGVTNPATDVLVPLVHRANSGWNSDLYIQNTSNANTTVSLQFVPRTGSSCNPCVLNNYVLIGDHGSAKISVGGLTNLSYPFVGSVRVTADQPLAIASTQFNGNSQLMETSNSQPPATEIYAPLIQNNNSGWLSGVTLSRVEPAAVFNLFYYNHNDGYQCYYQALQSANPYIAYAAIPTPIPSGPNPCSSKTPSGIFNVNTASMVGNVNQLQGTTNATTYAAIGSRGTSVIVPKFRRDSGWMDGFVIANPGSATANITVFLYNLDGSFNRSLVSVNPLLPSKRSVTVFSQSDIPAGFNGSAVVVSDQPIAVSVNSYKPGSGDAIGSYPATHR